MQTLKSYLEIPPEAGPEAQFARGAEAAEQAVEKIAAIARNQHFGWLKEKLVRAAARRVRVLMGARETPKFTAVRTMGIARAEMLAIGRDLADAGVIDLPEDLAFLRIAELEKMSRKETVDWRGLIASRKAVYAREQRRRREPRVLVSDGRAYYEGMGMIAAPPGHAEDSVNVLAGSPVSSGVVEGTVHVVLDPNGARLSPGDSGLPRYRSGLDASLSGCLRVDY